MAERGLQKFIQKFKANYIQTPQALLLLCHQYL